MSRILSAVGVHAAARHDGHVGPGVHIKIIVYQIVHAALGDAGRDVDGHPAGPGVDVDIQAGLIRFYRDADVGRGLPGGAAPVFPDVVGPHKFLFKTSEYL